MTFANKVSLFGAYGFVRNIHSALAFTYISNGQAVLHPDAKKANSIKHVKELFLVDFNPKPISKSRNGNSSKTTFAERFEVIRFNERGEPGRSTIMSVVQQHKGIGAESEDMYGLRTVGCGLKMKGVKR